MSTAQLQPAAGQTTGKQRPDTIWYTRCPVPSASGVAIRQGWLAEAFTQDNIAVRSLRHAKEHHVRESHFTHTLDNSFRQGGNTPALYAKSEGSDTVLIGLQLVDQYQGLLVRAGSEIATVADLRGKRLALPVRTKDRIDFWRATILQGYAAALRQVGLTLADVKLVEIAVPYSYLDVFAQVSDSEVDVPRLNRQHLTETIALLRDEVDAVFGYSAWGTDLREHFGLRQLSNNANNSAWEDRVNNEYPETLTVSGGLLREHPDLVDRYVLQLLKTVQWGKTHADAVKRILAQELGVAEFWIGEGTSTSLDFSLDKAATDALEVRKNFLLEHGFIRNDVAIAQWADNGPLTRALAQLHQQ